VLAIIKKSARAFDRRTGCRHPPVDKDGIFVLKYSWVPDRGKRESPLQVLETQSAFHRRAQGNNPGH
jgi:hypothetical protein